MTPPRALEDLFTRQRGEFPGMRGELVHLNNAAGSEMPEGAIAAMTEWMRSSFTNEGKIFRRLQACSDMKIAAHEATADLLGAAPDEVALGANTTSNLFYVSRVLARRFRPGDRVLVSEACHEANIAPWVALRDQGIDVDFIPMRPDTHLDYAWLEQNLDERTRLVSFGASSNGTGTMHDIGRVVSLSRRVSALVSLDAAHFAPHQPIDVSELGVDLLFFSIYKCFGPHLGGLYIRRGLCEELVPYGPFSGGPGARGADRLETGTRNLEAYAGWLGAIDYLERLGRAAAPLLGGDVATRRQALRVAMRAIAQWEADLTEHADARLAELPGIELYRQEPSDHRPRLGVFSFNVRGRTPVEIAHELERADIEAVVGNNGAMRTMARLARDFGEIGVRLSIAHYNTRRDVDRAIELIERLAAASLRPG